MNNSVSQELLKFLQKSPTAFHAVQQMRSELLAVDFTELKENQRWNIECGKHYFVTRNDSSLISFTIPENGIDKMHILTSHSDSPTFKIKRKSGDRSGKTLCEIKCRKIWWHALCTLV